MRAAQARSQGWKTTGEVADILGTTARTIHYYAELGLIEPKLSDGGTRFFSGFDIQRFDICLTLSRLGVPLKTIQELGLIRPSAQTGRDSSRQLVPMIQELRAFLETKISTMRDLLDDMDTAERHIRACFECPNQPTREACPDCPCETELSTSALLHLTWDPDRGAPARPDRDGATSGFGSPAGAGLNSTRMGRVGRLRALAGSESADRD